MRPSRRSPRSLLRIRAASLERGIAPRAPSPLAPRIDLDGLHERRVVVFAGPVLGADDPEYRGVVRLPREHWKIVVDRLGDAIRARAFLLAQDLSDVQPAYLDGFETYEVSLDDLAERTGLDLSGIPVGTRSRGRTATPTTPRLVASVDDVDW